MKRHITAAAGLALAGLIACLTILGGGTANAAPAKPAIAAASSSCNAPISGSGNGYMEVIVTKLVDHGSTADYQVAVTNRGIRPETIRTDRIVSGIGDVFRGKGGTLGIGQTTFWRANVVWQQDAVVQTAGGDLNGHSFSRTCRVVQ
jgi:hypothetical protein